MNESATKLIELISALTPIVLLIVTVIGLLIGHFFYGISLLQPLEKIANEQHEYRRKNSQEELKRAITKRHLMLGNEFLDVGNLKAARKEFEAALLIDPINEAASMGLFKSQINDGIDELGFLLEEQKKKIDLIFQYKQDDPHGHYFLGMLYRNFDHTVALEHFRKAIASNPNFADAYYRIGMIYEVADELETALALPYYEKALELSKHNQNYLNNVGYQYFQVGQYTKAIECFQTLIKIDKYDILPYLTISSSYLLSEDFERSSCYAQLFADIVRKKQTVFELGFNKLNWYFESFQKTKVVMDTPDKKKMYGFMSAHYKSVLVGKEDRSFLDEALTIYNKNKHDHQCIVELIKFECINYLKKTDNNYLNTLSKIHQDCFVL